MRNRFADVIYEIGQVDDRICAIVADISPAGSMSNFREQFPDRFINCGVAEQSMIGIAAGMALRGMKPFCYTIATFSLYRPFEMIRVDLCYQNLPVTVIGMGAGLVYSTLGGTHHSMEDVAVASAVPNMTVIAPCDPQEMREATKWCALENSGPVYMRLGKTGEPDLTSAALEPYRFGKIRYITKGTDVAVVSYGTLVNMAGEVASECKDKGLSTSLISSHTIKPFDRDGFIQVLRSHSKVIVMEEHVPSGGLSSRIKELAWDIGASCELHCFTLKDEFIHFYGSYASLLERHGLSTRQVIEKAGL